MVRTVLDGTEAEPRHHAAVALSQQPVPRLEMAYELTGQLDNFNHAYTVLMEALDHYGNIG